MSLKSSYKIGLGPKILGRAKIILGSLLAFALILIIAGLQIGISSEYLNQVLIQPFREFGTDLEKAINATPAPTPTPLALPSPTSSSSTTSTSTSTTKVIINQTTPVVQKTQPVARNCINKNIREGEFASNKCYAQADYEDLQYYLDRFNSATFNLDSAVATMRITCSGSDFFKDSCERDKQKKGQAESDISKYRGIIQGIIAKGR